jgi:hypothetical protein
MRYKIMSVQLARLAFSKRLKLIVLTALLAGCGGPVRDTDPRISELIHQCFATVKEAIFLSDKCDPLGSRTYCDTVRSLNPNPDPRWQQLQYFPPSLQAYRDDPVYWTGRIHEEKKYKLFEQLLPDHVVLYGGVPIGTSLEIVQISRWFNGENGTFWIGYANIQEGEFKGRRILLPWEGGRGSGGWIRNDYDPKAKSRMDPGVDSHYLTKCEAKATVPVASPR